eukprot:SAG11_NODE_641_length_8008_cov_2.916171_8_plen_201_part_00
MDGRGETDLAVHDISQILRQHLINGGRYDRASHTAAAEQCPRGGTQWRNGRRFANTSPRQQGKPSITRPDGACCCSTLPCLLNAALTEALVCIATMTSGCRPPIFAVPAGSIFERLTDPEHYTGTHKHRFDYEGNGKGLAGRDSNVKGSGSMHTLPLDAHHSKHVLDLSQVRVLLCLVFILTCQYVNILFFIYYMFDFCC